MDHDGDKISNKPLNSKEAVEDVHKAQNSLLNAYDYDGNFRRATGKDGTQTYYSLSRDAKHNEKPKKIRSDHPFVKAIMDVKKEI